MGFVVLCFTFLSPITVSHWKRRLFKKEWKIKKPVSFFTQKNLVAEQGLDQNINTSGKKKLYSSIYTCSVGHRNELSSNTKENPLSLGVFCYILLPSPQPFSWRTLRANPCFFYDERKSLNKFTLLKTRATL